MSKHILFISSEIFSLINFRSSLIKDLIDRGHKVTILFPEDKYFTKGKIQKLKSIGVVFKSFLLSRNSLNIFKDYLSYKSIFFTITKCKPDIVIANTAKPVIYAGIALLFFPEIIFTPLITGLGYGFTDGHGFKRKFIRKLLIFLYRIALKRAKNIIFQNQDDKKLFYQLKIISNYLPTHIIHGSGVDLGIYPFSPPPKKPIFLMLARLLIDKGVREYVEAARIVRTRFPEAIFQLAGRLDSNPSSICPNELKLWIKEGIVKYLGEISNVQKILASCRFYVLPSYREGTPRSILEALATGRPVITTDAAGCRETVTHGKNGLLVVCKNSKSLADAMLWLLQEKESKIQSMGKASFILAKKKYDVKKVNKKLISILNL